jgi:tetratricopeptide (TPR) repeat protein
MAIAALLSACAGAQKPAPVEAAPRSDEAQPDVVVAPPEEAGPAATPASPEGAAAPSPTATAPAGPSRARPGSPPPAGSGPRPQFAHAVQLEQFGDLEGAAAVFGAVRRSGAELPWAGLNEGLLEERLGHPEKALAAYEATVTAFPGFAPAAQNLVRLWRRQGRPLGEVEQELRTRLARAEGVGLRVGLAEVLLAAGNEQGAEEECKKALKADEKNVPAMIALANAYASRKRLELARMVLENARQVDESDPAIWNRLGFVELALGNRPQAIDHFKAAASLRADYPEAHANYGAILADADDFPAAVQELELAVRYAPRSAGTWLDLGNAYRGLQDFAKAEEAYGKALQLEPALNDARFNLAVLYLDVPKPGLATVQRLERGLGWFEAYEQNGGSEPRVAGYRKDAAREIDREQKRLAREEKDRLRREAEAATRAAEEARRLEEERAAAAAAATPAPPAPAAAPANPPPPLAPPAGTPKEGGDK